jgi:hypothetical protein
MPETEDSGRPTQIGRRLLLLGQQHAERVTEGEDICPLSFVICPPPRAAVCASLLPSVGERSLCWGNLLV